LGVVAPMGFQVFKERLQRLKLIALRSSLYHWKALGKSNTQNELDNSFPYLKHKLCPKEGSGVKLPI
jgi:hypothetical protein